MTEKIINISQFDSSSDCDSDQSPPPSERQNPQSQPEAAAVSEGEGQTTQCSKPGVQGRKKSFLTFPGPKEVTGPSSFLSDQVIEAELQFCLRQLHCYEDTSGFRLRGQVVREIEELMKVWVREETEAMGRLVCYGSYKLSVIDSESDLDLLCVVPRGVTRNSFFTSFYQRLQNKVRSRVEVKI